MYDTPEAQAQNVYSPGPAITGKIKLVGHAWAHVKSSSEFCDIQVYECVDIDLCNDEPLPDNYYKEAIFDGGAAGECKPARDAAKTKWYAKEPGESTVTATLTDHSDSPHSDADDPDVTITLDKKVGGFTVYVLGNVKGDIGDDIDDWQIEGGKKTEYKDLIPNTWSSEIKVTGNDSNEQVKKQTEQYASIGWTFKTNPSDAKPRKDIKAGFKYNAYAKWKYSLVDDDEVFEGGGAFGVSLGYILGISYAWVLPGDEEASFAGALTYVTDINGVGTNHTPDTPTYSDTSSKYTIKNFPFEEEVKETLFKSGTVTRPNDGTVGSKFTASAAVCAIDDWDDTGSWASAQVMLQGVSISAIVWY